ncbi:PspC domain-containing protein [Mesonia sp.]|uniref:PspC domain-containing protein n=1 Tax=Mesonia sp. TaxID=1960830 RepID=UPI00175EDFCD|nr:PspC domain-containing protein [Mesonia sp.]HIB37207.1 PspC domain-containing protein [Mesonia sp.]HIO26387.1 PspC domain-containing protein [Flavobacteriaceae bacterium]
MNKTVNINLAGIFFHIDEDAFLKLKNYLDAIKHSFTDSQGRDEIIQDIEARIAELFAEKRETDKQVIGMREVDAVIEIMGQPEDYKVDDDIFEDEEASQSSHTHNKHTEAKTEKRNKKLYRDPDNSYISGVSSGLGHYFNIDPVWVRVLFIISTILTSGTFLLVYIIFWIVMPEAVTTAEKLEMRGEPINISNIERKVKEGFDSVADKMKDVDYQKYGKKVNNGATNFFKGLGNAIVTLLKVFVKFIGILIILFAGSALIALLFSLLSVGTFGLFDAPWLDYVEMANIGIPFWLGSLLIFFAAGIPIFFLFILGLKILVTNLKSIGMPVKLGLLGLWLISIFVIAFLGVRQATERAFEGEVVETQTLPISSTDTLFLTMKGDNFYGNELNRDSDIEIKYDENSDKILYSRDVRLIIKSTRDSIAKIEIKKGAEGKSYQVAKERAAAIDYSTEFSNNTLSLNGYFTTPAAAMFSDQEITVTLYLPEGTTLFAEENTSSYHLNYSYNGDILLRGQEGHFLKIAHKEIICETCPVENEDDDDHFFEEKSGDHYKDDEEPTQYETDDDWYQEEEKNSSTQEKINQTEVDSTTTK